MLPFILQGDLTHLRAVDGSEDADAWAAGRGAARLEWQMECGGNPAYCNCLGFCTEDAGFMATSTRR